MSGLPSGFDPKRLTLGENSPIRRVLPPRVYVSTGNRSVWDRFNNLISSFGSWMTEWGAFCLGIIVAAIPAIWGIIELGGWVIDAFNDFFLGGILALGIAVFFACLGLIVVVAVYYVGFFAGWVFGKYICYNAWTFLSVLFLGGVIWWIVTLNSDSTLAHQHQQQVASTPAYTEYQCTAKRLNVRSAPSTNAHVIGVVSREETVKVYGFEGNFARIKWNNTTAYVSRKYISMQ